jgi:hypothetical protein
MYLAVVRRSVVHVPRKKSQQKTCGKQNSMRTWSDSYGPTVVRAGVSGCLEEPGQVTQEEHTVCLRQLTVGYQLAQLRCSIHVVLRM